MDCVVCISQCRLAPCPPYHPPTRLRPVVCSLHPTAGAIEAARRLERLAEMSGGGNRVTLSSLASIDEDGDQQVQQRLSLILKVRRAMGCLGCMLVLCCE